MKRFLIKFVVIVVLVLILAEAGFLAYRFVRNGFSWGGSKSGASYSILRDIEDIYQLNTAEYTMRVVFPYDFVNVDIDWNNDWNTLKKVYETDLDLFERKSKGDFYPNGDMPVIWRYADFYRRCRKADWDLAIRKDDFVVITSIVKAGYDLSIFSEVNLSDETIEEIVQVAVDDDGKKILRVKKPVPVITSFIIEDVNLKAQGYPDTYITPAQWRSLTTDLSLDIKGMVLNKGILQQADENGEILLTQIMVGAGYDNVEFF